MASCRFVLLSVCLLGLSAVSALHIPGFINGKPLRTNYEKIHFGDAAEAPCGVDDSKYEERWIPQLVDNFNSSDKRQWQQRAQINTAYFTNSSKPVFFLMIGGEGTASKQWVCWSNYTYITLAKQYNAAIIQLEHRFFGQSYPLLTDDGYGDMSLSALKYLTSQQALADLASFVTQYNKIYPNAQWVVFGGSYPGSLCAWFRAMYPNLSLGGICSSAPLWAKVNFFEYAQVMEFAISDYDKTCADNVRTAFTDLRLAVYTDKGRQTLNKAFTVTPALTVDKNNKFQRDVNNFFANVFNSFQGVIQYTFDARNNNTLNGYDLGGLCNLMKQPGDSFSRLSAVYYWAAKTESGDNSINVFDNNYDADLAPLKRVKFNRTNGIDQDISAGRGWMWLCCNAFGWLQTTDNANSMFNQMIPVEYYLQMCDDMFSDANNKIDTNYVTTHVAQAAFAFGNPWNFTASNTVLPNGGYDPWHALGSTRTDNATHQIPILTPKAAHCSDMYPARVGEPQDLPKTRALIANEVKYYLSGQTPNHLTTSVPTQTGSTSPPSASPVILSPLQVMAGALAFLVSYFVANF